jgi:DNA topoisomerase I
LAVLAEHEHSCSRMKLVIVESPNKTAKIRGFLGSGYRVAASFGHVRDLPVAGELAVAFSDGRVIPRYEPLPRAENALRELRALADQAEEVLLATDPDREGEAIAWHISEMLGKRSYRRVVFHAITKNDVTAAIAQPRALDLNLVNAQQARRVLDRVVGWLVSPTLRRIGKEARSAGRVQSVALRLVVERERDIARFNAVDHFVLFATVLSRKRPPKFAARLITWKGEPLAQRLIGRAVAEKTVEWCRRQPWQVQFCDRRDANRNPPPPFTTATVQQAASVRLGFNPDQTMKVLQSLFENGHITYHRTDSTTLSPEAVQAARALIAKEFPPAYLPSKAVVHAGKSVNAQEAHEAIRPTHPENGADHLAHLGDEGKLYELVWKRFIASQMSPGVDQLTTIDVACAPGTWNGQPMGVFQAKGKVLRFDGWRRLTGDDATEEKKTGRKKKQGDEQDDDEVLAELPVLEVGELLDLIDLAARERTTKPPPRYTQASLIKKLEHDGIGRPSTYANILRTILQRNYVEEKKRKLHATELGCAVIDFLIRHYAGNFIELDFTARLEADLDRIAAGGRDWQQLVTEAGFGVLKLAQRAGLRGNPLGPAAQTAT